MILYPFLKHFSRIWYMVFLIYLGVKKGPQISLFQSDLAPHSQLVSILSTKPTDVIIDCHYVKANMYTSHVWIILVYGEVTYPHLPDFSTHFRRSVRTPENYCKWQSATQIHKKGILVVMHTQMSDRG